MPRAGSGRRFSLRGIFARPRRKVSRKALVVTLLILVALLATSWLLVRNSSLVEVREVRVVGLSGHYDRAARAAVIDEARQMTTMNFDNGRIAEAAGAFVNVSEVRVRTDFPHGATIWVEVRRPVAVARLNGQTVVLSQQGEVMEAAQGTSGLPKIQASGKIVDGRVVSGRALEATNVLGAAPDTLLRKVRAIEWLKIGVVVRLQRGPDLYFGDDTRVRSKWRDAAAVLASSQARGAAYIDLRAPGRPAIGGLGAAPAPGQTEAEAAAAQEQAVAAPGAATPEAPAAAPEAPAPAPVEQPAPAPAPTPAPPPAPAPSNAGGAAPGV